MEKPEIYLRTHRHAERTPAVSLHSDAIESLQACITACTVCADACLAEEEHVARLSRCIRTDLDCADVCLATVRLLTRQTETTYDLVHAQLHTCVLACRICADECELHKDMHEHCRRCAEACRACQERCNFLLGELAPTAVIDDASDPRESPAYTPGASRRA